MSIVEVVELVLISILWINIGMRSIVSMNNEDNDAIMWAYVNPIAKVIFVVFAPILMLIYDRHVFYCK